MPESIVCGNQHILKGKNMLLYQEKNRWALLSE